MAAAEMAAKISCQDMPTIQAAHTTMTVGNNAANINRIRFALLMRRISSWSFIDTKGAMSKASSQ